MLNSKCEYLQNCITRITVNEETWERKERERREEEKEREEELRLEAFKEEKLAVQENGKRKRKASCLEMEQGDDTLVGTDADGGVTSGAGVDRGLATCDKEKAVPNLTQGEKQIYGLQRADMV